MQIKKYKPQTAHSSTVLTLTPKSTDVELQMAPMLAAANMASTAWIPLGR